jgi:hypothetical protein
MEAGMQLYTQGAGLSLPAGRGNRWSANHKGEVTLTKDQIAFAKYIGNLRNERAIKSGRKDTLGFKGDPLWIHTFGAYGEYAVCIYFGVPWPALVDTYDKADIPPDIEVKTRSRSYYDLPITARNNPAYYYVLVTGDGSDFLIHGWYGGREFRDANWIKSHRLGSTSWFVPQDIVHDIRTLKAYHLRTRPAADRGGGGILPAAGHANVAFLSTSTFGKIDCPPFVGQDPNSMMRPTDFPFLASGLNESSIS